MVLCYSYARPASSETRAPATASPHTAMPTAKCKRHFPIHRGESGGERMKPYTLPIFIQTLSIGITTASVIADFTQSDKTYIAFGIPLGIIVSSIAWMIAIKDREKVQQARREDKS